MPSPPPAKMNQARPGLFSKLLSDPYRMNMALMGLGLLGSKTAAQSQAYMGNLSQGLLSQAKSKAQAKRDAEAKRVNDALINYRGAQAADLAKPPSIFEGTGTQTQAMAVASRLGAKRAQGTPLTGEEEYALRMAIGVLQKPQVFQTPQGTAQIPGLNLDYLNQPLGGPQPQPGQLPAEQQQMPQGQQQIPQGQQPVPPPLVTTPPTPEIIGAQDPLRTGDVARINTAQETASKYSEMMPIFDMIESDLQIYPTGAAAGLELKGRQAAGIVGMGDEKVLAAGERLDKNMNKLVSQNMEFLKGAMSDGEREFTRSFSLGMDTSPEGNRAYIGFLRGVAERAQKKAPLMREYYRANNNSLDGFEDYWKQYINDNPVEIPEIGGGKLSDEDEELRMLKEEFGIQ